MWENYWISRDLEGPLVFQGTHIYWSFTWMAFYYFQSMILDKVSHPNLGACGEVEKVSLDRWENKYQDWTVSLSKVKWQVGTNWVSSFSLPTTVEESKNTIQAWVPLCPLLLTSCEPWVNHNIFVDQFPHLQNGNDNSTLPPLQTSLCKEQHKMHSPYLLTDARKRRCKIITTKG